MYKGQIIVMSGPSGVGKGSIRKNLDLNRLNVENSISMTTRAPRPEDVEGKTYYFTTVEDFKKRLERDEFLEHALYNENYYGTLKREVERIVNSGKNVLLEIETVGAQKVLELYPECINVFIMPPSFEALEARIRGRGDTTEENIIQRLQTAKEEMNKKDMYEKTIVNDDLTKATKEVQDYFEKELKSRKGLNV